MHESHTLIITKEDEGEEVEEGHQKHRGILGDEKNSSVGEVIEFLEIPIGSSRAPRARIGGKYDTSFSAVAE